MNTFLAPFIYQRESPATMFFRTSLEGARLNKNPFSRSPAFAESLLKRFEASSTD